MTLLSIPTQLLDITDESAAMFGGAVAGVVLICILVFLLPGIFYLLTLQNTLKAISLPNRKMRPGQVWLMFIPFFNVVWHFIIVKALSESIENEYRDRNIPIEHNPTYGIGLAVSILLCCCSIPVVKSLAALGFLVCWIIYWSKVSGYKNKILALPPKSDSAIFF
jgi:hypothetical protein